jgi:protocatechuate 3,4-dioxygenase beta subunit
MPVASYSTVTDSGGRFAMKDLEPGRYRLSANRTGFVNGEYGSRGPMRPGTVIALARGQALTDLKFGLTPQAVITGRVVDEDNEPVANAQVMAMRYRYLATGKQLTPMGSGSTNDLGEYRMFGVAPGRYFLSAMVRSGMTMNEQTVDRSATPRPDEGYSPTYYPDATDPASAVAVDIAAGSQTGGMDFRLSKIRTVRLRGRITNTTSATRQPVMLMLALRDPATRFMVMNQTRQLVNPQGAFEIRGVAPGSYWVTAAANAEISARVAVDVGSSDVENLSLTIGPGMEVTGHLRVEGDKSANLTAVRVALMNSGSGVQPASLDEQGAFTLRNVNQDRYMLNVAGLPEGFYVKSVSLGPEAQDFRSAAGIDLTKGATAPLEILIGANAGQVSGAVLDEKSQPAAGAMVVLVPQERDRREVFQLYKTAATDQYGRFTIRSVEPGEYKVFAWEDIEVGAYMDPDFIKPVESRGEPVSIKENSREDLKLKVIPTV